MHVLNVIELHRGASYGKAALINNKVINAPTDLRWWNLTWGLLQVTSHKRLLIVLGAM